MAVDVHVSMVVAVIVEVGTGHPKMLYYNITSVYKRSHGNVKRLSRSVTNTENDDPTRIHSVEDDIREGICHEAAKVAFIRGTAAFGVVGK